MDSFALVASPMSTVSALSMAALRVSHVLLPLVSISPTPLHRATDCVLLCTNRQRGRQTGGQEKVSKNLIAI